MTVPAIVKLARIQCATQAIGSKEIVDVVGDGQNEAKLEVEDEMSMMLALEGGGMADNFYTNNKIHESYSW